MPNKWYQNSQIWQMSFLQVNHCTAQVSGIVHFLKRILQVVDNAMFCQNVLLYFENDPFSPSF